MGLSTIPDAALSILAQQPQPATDQDAQQAKVLPQSNPNVTPVGSIGDLENRAAQAPQQTAQELQVQQQPQQPQPWSPNNPFTPALNDASARLRASNPPAQPMGRVKGLLVNFLSGMGNSMMHDAGLPTQYQQRQQDLENFQRTSALATQWENTQSEMQTRAAQLQNLQHLEQYRAQSQPLELERMRLANQLTQTQVQQLQTNIHAAISAADLQTMGIPAGVAQQFGGKPLSSADMQALMQMGTLTANKPYDYGQDGTGQGKGIWLVNKNYEPIKQLSSISETGRSAALAKQQMAFAMQGTKTGYAFDPSTNQTVLTSAGESRANGYQAFRPVTEANIRNDTHDSKILNDVVAKSNNVITASKALDQGEGQRLKISQAIAAAEHDEQFRLGAFGTQVPTAWFNNLMNSGVMQGATQQTKDYVVALLSLREAAMGMQRLLTGTARSNESQIAALQATLPGFEPNSALALQKMQAFTQNLDMLRQGIPKLPGIDVMPINRAGMGATGPQAQAGFSYNPLTDSLSPLNQLQQALSGRTR